MMQEKIDAMVNDVCELVPELKGREEGVRAMIAELLACKPDIAIDTAFVATLRTRLLTPALTPSPYTRDWSWFMVRFAPIGALAVLTLAILGGEYQLPQTQFINTPTQHYSVEPRASRSDTMSAPQGESFSAKESIRVGDAAGTMGMGGMQVVGDTIAPEMASNAFDVPAQEPGTAVTATFITLNSAAFLEISDLATPTTQLGVSQILEPGTHHMVVVSLRESLREGLNYRARLLMDNGNDIFDAMDEPVRDTLGNPLETTFVAQTGEPLPIDVMPMPAPSETPMLEKTF